LRDVYTRPLIQAFALQLVLVFLYDYCCLDLGEHRQACCYSSVVFWLGTVLILVRRPRKPTRGDLAFIRWGLLPIVLFGSELFVAVWKFKRLI